MELGREELKKKAMKAASAEEVMEIVRAAGEEITAEEAKKFFETLKKSQADQELSLDELEAVSGGRNAMTEGCAATVEPGSYCYFTDDCNGAFFVNYEVYPYDASCPDDGQNPMYWDLLHRCFICPKCGAMWDVNNHRIGLAQQGPLSTTNL